MFLQSRGFRSAAVIALLAMSAIGFDRHALAIQDSEDKVWFGPIGLARGDAARVNVYVIGNPDIAPWEFRLRVYDPRGVVVQDRPFRVAPGAIRSVDVVVEDEENFPVDRLGRRTLRAEIVGFNPQPDPPGTPRTSGFGTTFEVFSEKTGQASILLGGFDNVTAGIQTAGIH